MIGLRRRGWVCEVVEVEEAQEEEEDGEMQV